MERTQLFSKVVDIISEKCGIEPSTISEDTNFQNDLSLDSMRLVESIVEVEETFNIDIPDNRLFKINTVGDLVDFIEEKQ